MPLAVGQVLSNRYRIDALLGEGGMGAVYRALDVSLNLRVAIKENLDTSPEAQKQFEHEAQILAHLSHPNLPRVTDHFFIPGQGQYLVMDYVEGQDLQAMLDLLGFLPEPQVLNWISQVCDALAYLHSQPSPIIHRDIKPANIKVRPDGRAMLVDFGIAKVYDPRLSTTMGAKAVTPGYSPPEQYGSGTTDVRSDIYALGATLYHLLTGQKLPESVQRVVTGKSVPPPRQLNMQISPTTEQTILRAIEVATDRRFQNMEQMRASLTRPLRGMAVPAGPQGSARVQSSSQPKPTMAMTQPRPFPVWLTAGGGGLVVVILVVAVLALSGIVGKAHVAPAPTSSPVSTASLAPTATLPPAIPSSTSSPIPPSSTPSPISSSTAIPTTIPSTPTVAPSVTRAPANVATSTPASASAPVPVSPASGETVKSGHFEWKGSLPAGAAFVVVAVFVDGKPVVTSPYLTKTSWDGDLPAANSGGWSWSVSVVDQSSGRVLAKSNTVSFWYIPVAGGGGGGGEEPPWPPPP